MRIPYYRHAHSEYCQRNRFQSHLLAAKMVDGKDSRSKKICYFLEALLTVRRFPL
jgi:hypothetical protein